MRVGEKIALMIPLVQNGDRLEIMSQPPDPACRLHHAEFNGSAYHLANQQGSGQPHWRLSNPKKGALELKLQIDIINVLKIPE